jgi:hypothetical protein
MPEKVRVLDRLLRPNAPDMPIEALVNFVTSTPEGAAETRNDPVARGKAVAGCGPV